MRSFFVFFLGLLKKWWALMSCAVFTILSVVEVYVTNANKWLVRGTCFFAVLFLIVGFYQLWYEERRGRLEAQTALKAALAMPSVSRQEWETLAEKMGEACKFFRADYHIESATGNQGWNITGGSHSGICEARVEMAGEMLLRSKNVHIPTEIEAEQVHAYRWLKYMKWLGCFEIAAMGSEKLEDGRINFHHGGTTRNFAFDCARICLQCAAKEI